MTLAENIAKAFHDSYELHARVLGWQTQIESRGPWEDLPEIQRTLMVAVVDDLILKQVIVPGPSSQE